MKFKIGVLVLFCAALAFVLSKRAPVHAEKQSERKVRRDSSGKPLSLRALISAPVTTLRSESARISEECRTFEDAILGTDLNHAESLAHSSRLPSPNGCSPGHPRMAKVLQYYSRQCPTPLDEKRISDCLIAFQITRSTLADLARGSVPISSTNDLRELADIIVAEFGEMMAGMDPGAIARLREAAARMEELDPTLLPAVKAGAMGAIFDAITKKEKADWGDLERRIARIAELNPGDGDLETLERFVKTSGMDPDLVRQDSIARVARNPEDPREQEILAWANWKLGRSDEARAALAEALRLSPGDPKLKQNWAVIHQPGAKPDDFKIEIKLGVGFNDLLR